MALIVAAELELDILVLRSLFAVNHWKQFWWQVHFSCQKFVNEVVD